MILDGGTFIPVPFRLLSLSLPVASLPNELDVPTAAAAAKQLFLHFNAGSLVLRYNFDTKNGRCI